MDNNIYYKKYLKYKAKYTELKTQKGGGHLEELNAQLENVNRNIDIGDREIAQFDNDIQKFKQERRRHKVDDYEFQRLDALISDIGKTRSDYHKYNYAPLFIKKDKLENEIKLLKTTVLDVEIPQVASPPPVITPPPPPVITPRPPPVIAPPPIAQVPKVPLVSLTEEERESKVDRIKYLERQLIVNERLRQSQLAGPTFLLQKFSKLSQ